MAHRYEYSSSTVTTTQPVSSHTVVVNSAYQQKRPWNSGLCACTSDITICLCGTFCAICLEMQTASKLQEFILLPCCMPMALSAMRTRVRTEQHIEGSICQDCLYEYFCYPCANCQLAREVKFIEEVRTGSVAMVMERK